MKKILHIDDDKYSLQIVSDFLEDKGFAVVSSASPFVSLFVRKEKPDLLIMDIGMPILSGDRIVETLKSGSQPLELPVIYFSGQATEILEQAVKQTPHSSFVTKDEGLDRLLKKVLEILPP